MSISKMSSSWNVNEWSDKEFFHSNFIPISAFEKKILASRVGRQSNLFKER